MSIREEKASTLAEFFQAIKLLGPAFKTIWFRGHASHTYKLAPSIYRVPYSSDKELYFMNWFKSKGVKFFDDEDDYFKWLFIMQHYGTPTRLLDWSESALVALSFATQYRNKDVEKDDAVVWCLDPTKINVRAGYDGNIINICEDKTVAELYKGSYITTTKPLAIMGLYNSERIIAQKGVFTLFPMRDSFYLEDEPDATDYLMKIIIPAGSVSTIADDLYDIGINELSIFPEPESISKEIIRNYNK